jgi:molybdenum cofactor cytidylyltransferase
VNIAAIILAAGQSQRMGTPKALLQLNGESFLDTLIRKLQSQCHPVIVVLGANAPAIRSATNGSANFIVNAEYMQGMLTSLQCGLRALPEPCTHTVFTLVDHPDPAMQTVEAVTHAAPAPVVIPRFERRKGHPVRLSRLIISELLELRPPAKPTDVLYRHLQSTLFLDLDDPGIVDDVDDPEEYSKLLARYHPVAEAESQ